MPLMNIKTIAAIDGLTFWVAVFAFIVAFMVISSGDASGANSRSGNNKAPVHNIGGLWCLDVGDPKYPKDFLPNPDPTCEQICTLRNMGCFGYCHGGNCDLTGLATNNKPPLNPYNLSYTKHWTNSQPTKFRHEDFDYGLASCQALIGADIETEKAYCLCTDEKGLGDN